MLLKYLFCALTSRCTEDIYFMKTCILLLQGFQLLVCDWLLTTRLELWEHEMESGVVSSYQNLPGFRQDLNILQKLAGHMPGKIGRCVLNCGDDENIVIYVLLYSRDL